MAPLDFNIVMPLSSADGYGYSGEALVKYATQQGANIGVFPHDWVEDKYTEREVLDLKVGRFDDKNILVVYFIPYAFHHFRNKFTIGQTMFETTEIPDTWARFCHIPQGLIVPSEFCREVFAKKVNRPIEVVPLGVDIETYYYVEREPSDTFTFLMTGLLHYRKGAEFAVKAFQEEFKPNEPVRLVLKTRKGFFDIGDQEITDDRIEVVNYDYSREEMLDLYHAADCFLAPSRGEASGLTPREAMSTGLPVIATNWGGLKELTSSPHCYALNIDGVEEAPPVCSSYDAGITQGEPIGDFSIPSVTHLRELMREVYETKPSGQDGSNWVASNFSYNKCAQTWLKAIRKLYAENTIEPYEPVIF